MTQTEMPPNDPSGHCAKRRSKTCFVWMALGFLMLVFAGAATLTKCPWLFPMVPLQQIANNSADNSALEQRIKQLETRVDELSQKQTAPTTTDNPDTTALVKNLQTQVETLQAQNAQQLTAVTKAMSGVVAFWELRETVAKGQAFSAQLDHFKSITGDDNRMAEPIAKLAPYAGNPPPSLSALKASLMIQEEDVISPPTQGENLSLWERLKNILRPLISVHQAHNPQFDNLENALDKEDAPAASAALKTLPQDSQKKLEALQTALDAHISIDEALNSIQKNLEGE